MNLFFDTSALVKYFHAEAGTSQVVNLMDEPANEIWVSDLAFVMASANLATIRVV